MINSQLKPIKEKKTAYIQKRQEKKGFYREPEQIELFLPPREREQVKSWRGKKIEEMTREEAGL